MKRKRQTKTKQSKNRNKNKKKTAVRFVLCCQSPDCYKNVGPWRGIFEPSTATFLSKRKRVWMDNTGQISQRHLVNHPQKSTIPKT